MTGPLKMAVVLFILGLAVVGAMLAERGWKPPAAEPEKTVRTDFTLETPDGRTVSLEPLIGRKPVLLVFWASWCPDCDAAVPHLKALQSGPLADRIELLAINYLESREKVVSFIKDRDIRYTVLLDGQGQVFRAYHIVGIPTYILIDRAGMVVFKDHVLPDSLETYL